ncbi:HYR domain-containing protein [Pontibacillus salipaludis]|uniref:HYR domain-containing protein n=1 Tax=Pontibacillus salipaludis TaxID=1697394 RepID=UPI0031ED1ABD
MATEVYVPSDYPTIQDGVNAVDPGGTVYVEAGLYTPLAPITINKPATLLGPQANVDPRPNCSTPRIPGDPSTEAIIDGGGTLANIIIIQADDVTINGFEVRNGVGDLITSQTAPLKLRPIVSYNIVHRGLTDEGIQLRGIEEGLITFNHVYDIEGDGINVCCGSNNNTISYNEVHEIRSTNAALYFYEASNFTIEQNIVYDVPNNEAIKLGDSGDDNLTGGVIRNNIAYNLFGDGISLRTSNTIVDGNEVYNSRSVNGAIYIDGRPDSVSITNNCIRDNGEPGDLTYGVRIGKDANLPTNVIVTGNNIYNNVAGELFYNSINPPALDAEGNWWGSVTGPPPGSIIGNVDFIPFLTEPAQVCNPSILCPDDITVSNDPGECSAFVSFEVTARSNDCGIVDITCNGKRRTFSPPQQEVTITEEGTFPVGVTNITCTTTNASGDQGECSFTVTVNDIEPPLIACPEDIVVGVGPGSPGTNVNFPNPSISDNCPGVVADCIPASGSFFPVGSTVVTCTATDTSGNTSRCTFTIRVAQINQLSAEVFIRLTKEVDITFPTLLEIPNELSNDQDSLIKDPLPHSICIKANKVYDWIVYCTTERVSIPLPDECIVAILDCQDSGQTLTRECRVLSDQSTFSIAGDVQVFSSRPDLSVVPVEISVPIILIYRCNNEIICYIERTITTYDEVIVCYPEGTTLQAKVRDGSCRILYEVES